MLEAKILPIIKSLSNCVENKKNKIEQNNLQGGDEKGRYRHGISNLISYEGPTACKSVTVRKGKCSSKPIKKIKSFNPSFETYYYRDLLWKVNFSNQIIVEPPL
jgi:hypothetical protein